MNNQSFPKAFRSRLGICLALAVTGIALGLPLVHAAEPVKKTKVILLAGQSNMVGNHARVVELAAGEARLPASVTLFTGDVKVETLNPKKGFGPEVGLAHALAAACPEEKFLLVKFAVEGTPIERWMKASAIGEPLYKPLMRAVAKAVGQSEVEYAAFLWMQGEANANRRSANYRTLLHQLVEQSRIDLNAPRLPFILGRVNPVGEKYSELQTIRDIQEKLPAEIPFTAMVDTDDLTKIADQIHYDARGQLELGRRFAAAYLKLRAEAVTNREAAK